MGVCVEQQLVIALLRLTRFGEVGQDPFKVIHVVMQGFVGTVGVWDVVVCLRATVIISGM
jgi:hypothetical protein